MARILNFIMARLWPFGLLIVTSIVVLVLILRGWNRVDLVAALLVLNIVSFVSWEISL